MTPTSPYKAPLREGGARVRELQAALKKARATEIAAKVAFDTAGEGLNAWSTEYRIHRYEAREAWRTAHDRAEGALEAWNAARREMRSLRASHSRWEAERESRKEE